MKINNVFQKSNKLKKPKQSKKKQLKLKTFHNKKKKNKVYFIFYINKFNLLTKNKIKTELNNIT